MILSDDDRKSLPRTLLALWALYVLTAPFYVVRSGLPQPADMLLLCGALLFLSAALLRRDLPLRAAYIAGGLFALLTVLVNLVHNAFYPDDRFVLSALYYAYNVLIFVFIAELFTRHGDALRRPTTILIALAALVQLSCAALFPDPFYRQSGTFNNPNQLALWSLLSACIVVLMHRGRKCGLPACAALVLLALVQGVALSKAGLITFALLLLIVFLSPLIGQRMRLFSLAGLCLLLLYGFTQPPVSAPLFDGAAQVAARLANIGQERDDSAAGRGYGRLADYPAYMLLGAGEGGFDRFGVKAMELHSGLATILFSYGIAGLSLFLWFLTLIFRRQAWYCAALLLPVLLFGLVHQNMRAAWFWVFLAIALGTLLHRERQRPATLPANTDAPRT